MKPFAKEKSILPEYPRTLHLPWKPNADRTDVVAQPDEAKIIFEQPCSVQEKVDGSNCGMALVGGEAVIRNREFILSKGFNLRKRTPAKLQFGSVFTWFYENIEKFEKLNEIAPNCSVYGEWMIAQHGLEYDCLPSWFMTYDLYAYDEGYFLPTPTSRQFLSDAGFSTVPLIKVGPIENYEELEHYCNSPSRLTSKGNIEGVYLKSWDQDKITHRFKMVRSDFIRGAKWSDEKITKNSLAG